MSDTPTSEPAPPPRPTRPWTILGRLSQAVREQNWFAVTLEVCIVIVGVVIGFQVTGWGQARADRAKEQAYLTQIAEDLRGTERQILWADSLTRPFDAASSKLVRAYFVPEPPPADSILRWRLESTGYRPLTPVTGTADALIASGDLALIQNDSLRSEITTYVPFVKSRQAAHDSDVRLWWAESVAIANRYDLGDMFSRTMEGAAIDSAAIADSYFFLPSGERRRPFPVDVDAMLADRDAYNRFRSMLEHKRGMYWERQFALNATRQLLDHVEAELGR